LKKVLLFSILLIVGLCGSQFLSELGPNQKIADEIVRFLTTLFLGFIMIHVGYEFEIDRTRLKSYGYDYLVAATSAAFPWILVALYFVFIMGPSSGWFQFGSWQVALSASKFAATTSAGVLFSMLAAAGLSVTWSFRKTRILAIFDDLNTVLLMIPLKILIIGLSWQLGVIVTIMVLLIWIAWKFMRRLRLPVTWPYVITYAAIITIISEVIYLTNKSMNDVIPIHIEVLLPAFVLGTLLARPAGQDPHVDDAREGHQEGPESPEEQKVSTIVSAAFMVFVGLSMPVISLEGLGMTLSMLITHVLVVTILANLGKMFPLFCYKKEATWRERLAICIGMWPRGEVGAGVLVVSVSYGIGGDIVVVAVLSLALNLLLTGVFIYIVKRLLARVI
jgi:Kef-type K+ transport system membrane component KefB